MCKIRLLLQNLEIYVQNSLYYNTSRFKFVQNSLITVTFKFWLFAIFFRGKVQNAEIYVKICAKFAYFLTLKDINFYHFPSRKSLCFLGGMEQNSKFGVQKLLKIVQIMISHEDSFCEYGLFLRFNPYTTTVLFKWSHR